MKLGIKSRRASSSEDQQVKHIRSLPINQEIIDSHVENLHQRVEAHVAYDKILQQYEESRHNGARPEIPHFRC